MSECMCEVEPVKAPWLHDRSCLKWSPPLAGRGSSQEARRQAIAAARQAVDRAKRQRTAGSRTDHREDAEQ
jgi:hypothetical protein